MELDFYNHAANIGYPFVDMDEYSFGGGAVLLPQSAVLDLGVLFGVDAGFIPGQHKVWLWSIMRDGGSIRFSFMTDAPGFSGDLHVDVPSGSLFAAVADFEAAPGLSDMAAAFIVTGDLVQLAGQMADLTIYTTDSVKAPEIEPANVQSLAGGYARSVLFYNDPRLRVSPPAGCEPPESSPAHAEPVPVGAVTSGDVVLVEGYNSNISVNRVDNAVLLGAGRGYGMGMQCGEVAYEPGDFGSSPGSELLTGGPKCSELLYTINGIDADESNSFLVQGSRGIDVLTYPEQNKIVILFELTRRVLCETD